LLRYADDHPDLLVDDDVVNIVYSMALAGHETTTSAIAGGLRHLLARPEQWAALCREPGLIPNAVEELLRFDPPILGWRRITTVATEVGGVAVPEGAKIVMLFASAHRDAAHFPDPDVLDVRRPNAVDHLSFGKGVHFCLGAPLARLEVRIVLELLTELAPDLRLVPGQSPAYSPNVLFRTLEHLLVERPGS
jgi:cytochrome P450